MSVTIAQALAEAIARLGATSTAPRPDAEELLSRLTGLGRGELALARERALSGPETKTLDAWLARRERGEPVQYITGRAAFRDLDLVVGPGVLVPRPETEGLVEAVLQVLAGERARWSEPRVLDLGTGSGAIAISIASEWPAARVTATDASEQALDLARANAAALGLETRVRFARGEWLEAVDADERFEVIVSNPPYVAEHEAALLPRDVRDWEPAEALYSGPSGLEALRAIIEDAPRHLVARGLLALELAEARAEEVAAWFDGARDWSDARVLDDLSGRPRVLLARREAGPAIAPAQWPEER
jgi:release factor glutamine methyltransferase